MVPTFPNSIWVEMAVFANRSMKNARRMPELFSIRLGTVRLLSFQPSIWGSNSNHRTPSLLLKLRPEFDRVRRLKSNERFPLRAIDGSVGSAGDDHTSPNGEVAKTENKITITNLKDSIGKLQGMISSVTPLVFSMRQREGFDLAIGLCIATAFVVIAVRVFVVRKSKYDRPGSVADLVRRGQLRSDRRGISTPLKYDDPFNNPLVKLGKGNSHGEVAGGRFGAFRHFEVLKFGGFAHC
ncbi:hypothetical protein C1H46_043663 [Malus baccata]|uniref:Uncharacterized protein n=1 Tax=Malus baccata TaxID=106549 RepID=A0A540K9C4_MALBA|nr:hypothetical protein C1H46_043663 [Malus baccata]